MRRRGEERGAGRAARDAAVVTIGAAVAVIAVTVLSRQHSAVPAAAASRFDFREALRAARPGAVVNIPAGRHEGGVTLRNKHVIRIVAEPGAVITGGGEHGLVLEDCANVTIEGLTVEGYEGRGVYLLESDDILFRRCVFRNNGRTANDFGGPPGLLANLSHRVTLEECEASGNGSHGVYLSRSGDGHKILRCVFKDNGSAGLQINATHPDGSARPGSPRQDGRAFDCLVQGNRIFNNNAAMNLFGVERSVFRDNWCWNNRSSGVSLWHNNMGAEHASRDNLFEGNYVLGGARFAFQFAAGATGNSVTRGVIAGPVAAEEPWTKGEGLRLFDGPTPDALAALPAPMRDAMGLAGSDGSRSSGSRQR